MSDGGDGLSEATEQELCDEFSRRYSASIVITMDHPEGNAQTHRIRVCGADLVVAGLLAMGQQHVISALISRTAVTTVREADE